MALVNDKKFPVYDLDTKETIINRIAAVYETLPKFLYFSEEIPEDFKHMNIHVENLFDNIKKDAAKNKNFQSFLPKIQNKLTEKIRIEQDILYPWLAFNIKLQNETAYGNLVYDTLKPLIDDNYFVNTQELKLFWTTTRLQEKDSIKDKIRYLQDANERTEKLYKRFQKIKKGVEYTELITDRIAFQITLNLIDITILEIFNNILLKEEVPFATCKNYYKILKDYLPNEEWSKSSDDLLLKVCSKNVVDPLKYKDYVDVLLKIDEDKNIKTFIKLITERNYLSQQNFIDRFLSSFVNMGEITYSDPVEEEVVGSFFVPNFAINTYVFSDLVMNDVIFSTLINIDESTKSTKKKSENSLPWLHIHFDHPSTGKISAGITQKISERSDPEMKELDIEFGVACLRVRARGKDKKSIRNFQKIFSKLLVIYQNNFDEIVEIYKKYIPNFGEDQKLEIIQKKEKINTEAPEIFVKNYSRNCTDARMPKIISKKDAKNYEENKVISFPRKQKDGRQNIFPSDGAVQKYFVCPNPEYPYPGLQINKLPNADKYPYVPCCFKNDQHEKKGGIFRHYFFDEPLEIKEKKQQELIITDKFLGIDKFGVLPENLVKLFEIIDPEPDYKYIRVGVERNDANKSSFLNCIMLAMDDKTDILDLKPSQRGELVKKERKKLSMKKIAPLARQCAYDIPIKKLIAKIADSSENFEAKKFIQLLENYYGCIIFLFNSERLIFPSYSEGLYKFRVSKETPCVFIYEHMGSESDHAKYPQCELIVRWNTKSSEDTQYLFNQNQRISQSIMKISEIMSKAYALNEKLQDIVFPLPLEIIKSQVIDSYGKTRQLNIEFEGSVISMIISPIPPISVIETEDDTIFYITVKKALKFMKTYNVKIESQSVIKNFVKEINGLLGNVKVFIPVEDSKEIGDIPIIQSVYYPEYTSSQLNIYNKNKKMARYLSEYIFWIFSKFFHEKKQDTITDKFLANFAQKKLIIQKDWEYSDISKTFSLKSSIIKDGKIVVTSDEMLKRLMYVLKLYSIRDLKNLINYHERTVIVNFYEDIHDFTQYSTQVILYGEDTVDKWINESKIFHTLTNKVFIGIRSPYFFRNSLISPEVYLAQNVSDLSKALNICHTWRKYQYNPGFDSDKSENYGFVLYLYVNEKNIKKVTVGGRKKSDFKILGYKIEGIPGYTCLMNLSQ